MPTSNPADDEERENDVQEADRRFSQERDDRAGRSWHGLNSEVDEVGRFDEDTDEAEEAPRPGRVDDI